MMTDIGRPQCVVRVQLLYPLSLGVIAILPIDCTLWLGGLVQ